MIAGLPTVQGFPGLSRDLTICPGVQGFDHLSRDFNILASYYSVYHVCHLSGIFFKSVKRVTLKSLGSSEATS